MNLFIENYRVSKIMTECFYNKNYLIYSDGGVFSKPRKGTRKNNWLTGCINSDGYCNIKINNKTYKLHRLVVIAF